MFLTPSPTPPFQPQLLSRQHRFRRNPVIATLIHSSSPPMETGTPIKHVLVCGGGVIGVCTAYFLSKKGAAVTLIEKSSVACAASGKAGGFLALDWCDGGPLQHLARASFNLHRSLAEELGGAESYGYRALNTLSLKVNESKDPPPAGRGSGLPDWIDGPAKGGGSIGSTETTAQVHPQLFTRALLSKAESDYGLEVVIGNVVRVEAGGGRARAVVLEGGREIEADAVVLALGPWSGKFGLLSSLFRVDGLKAHSIVLKPKRPEAITPHALFLSFVPREGGPPMDPEVYPRPTGEVYVCGMSSREEVPDNPEQISPDPVSIRVLKRVAGAVSTHLTDAEVKAEQACYLPCTEDEVPVIGEVPHLKGCYVATGHSCWGILNGPATGLAVAELVFDGAAEVVNLSKFSPSRFVSSRTRRDR